MFQVRIENLNLRFRLHDLEVQLRNEDEFHRQQKNLLQEAVERARQAPRFSLVPVTDDDVNAALRKCLSEGPEKYDKLKVDFPKHERLLFDVMKKLLQLDGIDDLL